MVNDVVGIKVLLQKWQTVWALVCPSLLRLRYAVHFQKILSKFSPLVMMFGRDASECQVGRCRMWHRNRTCWLFPCNPHHPSLHLLSWYLMDGLLRASTSLANRICGGHSARNGVNWLSGEYSILSTFLLLISFCTCNLAGDHCRGLQWILPLCGWDCWIRSISPYACLWSWRLSTRQFVQLNGSISAGMHYVDFRVSECIKLLLTMPNIPFTSVRERLLYLAGFMVCIWSWVLVLLKVFFCWLNFLCCHIVSSRK